MSAIFRFGFLPFGVLFLGFLGRIGVAFAQIQDFEQVISPVSFPNEFLDGWWGNEVRSTSSRVFQIDGQGRNGSRALAVQPISTFNGVIWVRLMPALGKANQVSFWAKSLQNGTGSRSAKVLLSWSTTLNGDYFDQIGVGEEESFPNATTEFKKYSFSPPQPIADLPEIFLKIEVNYGEGSGSAARWIMDDFEFGEVIVDLSPPKVTEVKGYSSKQLLLQFDEAIDPVFSQIPLVFSLEGQHPVQLIQKNEFTLLLEFENFLEEGKKYSLAVTQLPDLEGNFLQDTLVDFSFYDPTLYDYKSLVINEIMPAPRADQDLPNVEYIELYNSQEKEFRLSELLLSNSRSEIFLSEYWLAPKSFLILCPSGKGQQLDPYGEVLEVGSWPTMLNSGDLISLRTKNGILVDQLAFQTSSWGGNEFAQEGYSLEVPNPAYRCENSSLLLPSKDPLKGTPGRENSVLTDQLLGAELEIRQLFFKDSVEIIVRFEGALPPDFGKDQFVFSPILEVDTLFQTDEDQWSLLLKGPAKQGQIYELSLVGLEDCQGNYWKSYGSWKLIFAKKAQADDLELNELLFNPRIGDPKFVEIANVSSEFIDLTGWAIGNGSQVRSFGIEGLILPPYGYLALTTDTATLKGSYPKSADGNMMELGNLPSFPISGGQVTLLDSKGQEVDTFSFSEALHHPIIRDPKGISLERLRVSSIQAESNVWVSASSSEDYATPGKINSQAYSGELTTSWLTIEPEIFDPEGTQGPSITTIRYQLPSSGWVGTLIIFNSMGGRVDTLAQSQILGAEGVFTWTGTDAQGGRLAPGIYVAVFELFDLEGRSRFIRKTVVVASRL